LFRIFTSLALISIFSGYECVKGGRIFGGIRRFIINAAKARKGKQARQGLVYWTYACIISIYVFDSDVPSLPSFCTLVIKATPSRRALICSIFWRGLSRRFSAGGKEETKKRDHTRRQNN